MASGLARQVLDSIRQRGLLRAGDRVGAAVSGGADSVALLRLLLELRAELGIVLAVVHYHHGIRGAEADSDAALVAALAAEHKLELHTASGDAPGHARARGLSLEAAARELRYTFFRDLLRAGALTRIATGHTLDDQAETVLLRLIRGTGMRGLAGIHPLRREEGPGEAAIVRPLLGVRRREVEDYLRGLGQAWREDASNLDLSHTRNRVRHRLLPLLESEFNPAIVQTLAETAEIARAEEYDWQREVERAADKVLVAAEAGQAALRLEPLLGHPLAMQRRLLRLAAARAGLGLDFGQVEAVLRLAPAGAPAAHELPGGWVARRSTGRLLLARKAARREPVCGRGSQSKEGQDKEARGTAYEHPLPLPGQVLVPGLGTVIRARLVEPGAAAEGGYGRDQLLDPARLPERLTVRNWRPGDRFWPAHTRAPKKVKSLLQERRIGQPGRALWPVAVSGETLVWMRGFPVPQALQPAPEAARALVIEEVPGG